MHLILHLGAHGTDEGLIARWIAQNRTALEGNGVCAPAPRDFLAAVSEALDAGRDAEPLAREDALLRRLGASGVRRWMVLSAPGLLGPASDVLSPQGFYVKDVARRLFGLHSLFPRCRITVLLAVRGANGLLPRLAPGTGESLSHDLPMLSSDTLPWAQLVAAIRHHLPRARLVVWRHEDLRQVWPDILAQINGPERILPPAGLFDFAALGLAAEARLRMRRYLAANPPGTARQLRQVADAFGSRYGFAAAADPEVPGWVKVVLDRLDLGYRTEWDDIAGRAGVMALGR